MLDLAQKAEPAVAELLGASEESLFQQLGIRAMALKQNPELSGNFASSADYLERDMGTLDDIRDYGKRFFRRWNVEAFKLVCGTDPEDAEDRKKLADAFGLGEGRLASLIAAMLVAQLGLAPAVAAVIAVIVLKRFLFNPGYQVSCEYWKNHLPTS